MRLLNRFLVTREPYNIGSYFKGEIDGNRYVATEDGQTFLPWVNIPNAGKEKYIWTALIADAKGALTTCGASCSLTGNLLTTTVFSWGNGLLMDKGASLTFVMRGSYTDEDWQVMQAIGVSCWDKDTATY